MTSNEKSRIKKGIASYEHEQAVILRALRMKNGMTSKEFDVFFGDAFDKIDKFGYTTRIIRRPKKIRLMSHDTNSFILGSMFMLGDWSKWLHLMQLMIEIKLIEVKEIEGNIFYKIKTKGIYDNKK